jgi:penicillin-binding protein 1A
VLRLALRLFAGLVTLALVAGAAATVYLVQLPGVGGAMARVQALVRAHGGSYSPLPLPAKLADAVVALEDEHFYSNAFVNVFDGVARAALASLHGSGDPGGSTIDQQLAKQLYPSRPGTGTTLRQAGLGVKLALGYPRAQVLDMYLNVVYFGNGYWGYRAAAEGYFHLPPARLDWAQAALLAGLLQAPSAYDPLTHLQLARERQHQVLARLVANHYLSSAGAAAAYRAPLGLARG